ncbi:hypothetical protein SDC9_68708 [bioreactor metagenome]|uniref:Uncharacterized protein n=1 Tax=bioreactor metagenome TaxID=1076179 RepID=A0A644Y285_9ZZZZ
MIIEIISVAFSVSLILFVLASIANAIVVTIIMSILRKSDYPLATRTTFIFDEFWKFKKIRRATRYNYLLYKLYLIILFTAILSFASLIIISISMAV